jgi:hypothetical protein
MRIRAVIDVAAAARCESRYVTCTCTGMRTGGSMCLRSAYLMQLASIE